MDGRTLGTRVADFGAKEAHQEHQDAEVVLAEPLDGSTRLANTNANGKIVLIEHSHQEGGVTFVQKVMNGQNAGATAVIIYNNKEGGGTMPMPTTDAAANVTVLAVSISQADGIQLAAAIKTRTTTISLQGIFYVFVLKSFCPFAFCC